MHSCLNRHLRQHGGHIFVITGGRERHFWRKYGCIKCVRCHPNNWRKRENVNKTFWSDYYFHGSCLKLPMHGISHGVADTGVTLVLFVEGCGRYLCCQKCNAVTLYLSWMVTFVIANSVDLNFFVCMCCFWQKIHELYVIHYMENLLFILIVYIQVVLIPVKIKTCFVQDILLENWLIIVWPAVFVYINSWWITLSEYQFKT